ncbi:MAG: hypothetical protein V4687_01575 [Bacteroidota bacterium]
MKTYIPFLAIFFLLISCREPKLKLQAVDAKPVKQATADSIKGDTLSIKEKKSAH